MKQLSSDKYNVAWFKLAEFIERGEKERALALYRLLVHSFDNQALARQLEADILGAFEDETAIGIYEQAAQLYKKQGDLVQAAAVFEHLALLKSNEEYYSKEAIGLYRTLGRTVQMARCMMHCIDILLKKNNYSALQELVDQSMQSLTQTQQAEVYQRVILGLCTVPTISKTVMNRYLEKSLDAFLCHDDQTKLHAFLTTLKEKNKNYYDEACSLMNDLGDTVND